MSKTIENILTQAVEISNGEYYRLILLIGESGSGKTQALNRLSKKIDVPIINLNLLLSEQLLGFTPKQRSLQFSQTLHDLIKETNKIFIIDNTEILFDTSLKQDPLKLLQGISRNKTLIVSWNGKQLDTRLQYAEVGHPEYKVYEINNFLTVNMNGTYNFNSER